MVNKVLEDCGVLIANTASMHSAFEEAERLSDEIKELWVEKADGNKPVIGNDWLVEDAKLHLSKQEAICSKLDAAMDAAIKEQREFNTARRKWFDSKL